MGLLFQILHGFLMLPLQFGRPALHWWSQPSWFQMLGWPLLHWWRLNRQTLLPHGSPIGGLGISNCSGMPGLYFSDSLRSVDFLLAITYFCFQYDPLAASVYCSPGGEQMNHCIIHFLLKVQYVRLMELAGKRTGVGLVSLSGLPCKREWLDWAMMLAVTTCEDPWGDGGDCFRYPGVPLLDWGVLLLAVFWLRGTAVVVSWGIAHGGFPWHFKHRVQQDVFYLLHHAGTSDY